WLDAIQQESWQLELLISGFVLFLLTSGWQPIANLEYDLDLLQESTESYGFLNLAYYVFRTAYLSLLLCLIVHVTLRGLWIAAVGLRSISGDIEYDQLPYQQRFVDRLQRRLGSFDDYIARLERNCSVIFSLAFLIFFCFISLITWSISAVVLQELVLWITGGKGQGQGVLGAEGFSSLLMFILGVIYLFDFVTLGLLKRSRWLAKPYYYIYVFMGWITLARFYRPLYYNLIDNRFGRKLAIALPIIIFLILVGVSVVQIKYDYFPYGTGDGTVWQDRNNYDDENPNIFDQMWRVSLASKYAKNNYVEAFIPYRPVYHNPRIKLVDPGLEVSQYTGTKLRGAFELGERYNEDADYERSLAAFSAIFRFNLNDSLLTNASPLFHYHPERRQAGISYMIPVHDLPPGRHALKIQSRIIESDTLKWTEGRTIYFYK
ncbi:MAG: hypothetical protein AAGF89_16435, partial [Bacteroidota bacterium]